MQKETVSETRNSNNWQLKIIDLSGLKLKLEIANHITSYSIEIIFSMTTILNQVMCFFNRQKTFQFILLNIGIDKWSCFLGGPHNAIGPHDNSMLRKHVHLKENN